MVHITAHPVLLIALAVCVLTLCNAQSCSGTTTITTAPSGCATWSGDIVVPTSVGADLSLDGLEDLQGSLVIEEASDLTSISGSDLRTINDTLSLSELMILNEIDFPELTALGDLTFNVLPALQEASILTILGSLTELRDLSIINTALQELVGFGIETLRDITITNNNYLQEITIQQYNITGTMEIAANGRELEISMPNLEIAQNIAIANATRISTPSLRQAYALEIRNNYMTEFNGAPLLREADGLVTFADNTELTRIALPELRTVSYGLTISNNTKLEHLDELYSLESVDGEVDLSGTFTDIEFQNLAKVAGDLTIDSTAVFDCERLGDLANGGVIEGQYRCSSATFDNFTAAGTTNGEQAISTATGSTGSTVDEKQNASGGLSTGARVGIGIGVGGGVGTLVGALVGWIFHRRAKARKGKQAGGDISDGNVAEKDGSEIDPANMLGDETQKFELEQPLGEMGTGGAMEAQELPAKHGAGELDRSASTKGPPGVEGRHEMSGVGVGELDAGGAVDRGQEDEAGVGPAEKHGLDGKG